MTTNVVAVVKAQSLCVSCLTGSVGGAADKDMDDATTQTRAQQQDTRNTGFTDWTAKIRQRCGPTSLLSAPSSIVSVRTECHPPSSSLCDAS